MIYILFMCFLIFSFFDWRYLKKVSRHDGVLFPFCQLRRDIMSFLYENIFQNPGALSREEYAAVRRLSDTLNGTIRNYNQHKTLMFNMREMAEHLEAYRQAADTTLNIPNHPVIQEFHERFGRLLVKAFIAYTPLIRLELVLYLVARAYRLGKETNARRAIENAVANADKVRSDARRYGLLAGGAAV